MLWVATSILIDVVVLHTVLEKVWILVAREGFQGGGDGVPSLLLDRYVLLDLLLH